jgi:flagellar biosynthetic protein FliR
VIEMFVVPFSLILARVSFFVMLMPLVGGPQTPQLVKIGLSMTLAALWSAPLFEQGFTLPLASHGTVPVLAWCLALTREAGVGAALGFLFSLFLVPVRVAGEFLTQEIGLSFGSQVSGSGDGTASTPAAILEAFATLLLLGLDLHHVFLGALHASFARLPIGAGFALPDCDVVAAASAAEEWGLLLAAPAALCLFLTSVILALLTRAAPQLNLYTVGFPLRMIVGLGALLLLLPTILTGLLQVLNRFGDYLAGLV